MKQLLLLVFCLLILTSSACAQRLKPLPVKPAGTASDVILPAEMQIENLETRLAGAEAAARYNASLSDQQKAWVNESQNLARVAQQQEAAARKFCTAAGAELGKKPNGTPTCVPKGASK